MTAAVSHRLDGLEPDNLLAFLALLGLLRSLEAADSNGTRGELHPRVAWDVDRLPLRPRLFLATALSQAEICEAVASGIARLCQTHDFGDRADLDYSPNDARSALVAAVQTSDARNRSRSDALTALMTDAALRPEKIETVDPTPLCLQFGQGHQHFLERLVKVPKLKAPEKRGKGKKASTPTEFQCLIETLFQPWHRKDPTESFRWDPEEDVRYALMAGDPTDPAYKGGTQHGANRLAAIGLAALTVVPERRWGQIRSNIIGGAFDREGFSFAWRLRREPRNRRSSRGAFDREGFSFAWPIWEEPARLAAIRSLLTHPDLRKPGALRHLGVHQVMQARRVSVGRFMNFARAIPTIRAARIHHEEQLSA